MSLADAIDKDQILETVDEKLEAIPEDDLTEDQQEKLDQARAIVNSDDPDHTALMKAANLLSDVQEE